MMTRSEETQKLADKIEAAHDAARQIGGENYPVLVKRWIPTVIKASEQFSCSPLAAVPRLDQGMKRYYKRGLNDTEIMWLTAAAVEVLKAQKEGNRTR